ncbi:MAG: Smr/MutS family protein [Rhodovarius sp.]|nr:Smr/MutS family protein [Rhodovarius sp.]MCX7931076.1 Smr/MutS family protein [Rhodovarius sp.]MDW8313484.1 Smr/MutS family protein [Rhodovarius sp.]
MPARLRWSAEDLALWARYLEQVRPLAGRRVPAAPPLPPPRPVTAGGPAAGAASSPRPVRQALPPLVVGVAPAGLDASSWNQFRRGRLRPQRSLDLHGLPAAEAHALVRRFVRQAAADGLRCLCIITGKGRGDGGVLRRELPHWLNAPELRPLILAAAHPHDANPGAVHLLLRRRRA